MLCSTLQMVKSIKFQSLVVRIYKFRRNRGVIGVTSIALRITKKVHVTRKVEHSVAENRHCIHEAHNLLSMLVYPRQSILPFFQLPCPGENHPGSPVQCRRIILMRTSRDVKVRVVRNQNQPAGITPFSPNSISLGALAVLLLAPKTPTPLRMQVVLFLKIKLSPLLPRDLTKHACHATPHRLINAVAVPW